MTKQQNSDTVIIELQNIWDNFERNLRTSQQPPIYDKKKLLENLKGIFDVFLNLTLTTDEKDDVSQKKISEFTLNDMTKKEEYLTKLFQHLANITNFQEYCSADLLQDDRARLLNNFFSAIEEGLKIKLQSKTLPQVRDYLKHRYIFLDTLINQLPLQNQKLFWKTSHNLRASFYEHLEESRIQDLAVFSWYKLSKKLDPYFPKDLTPDSKQAFAENLKILYLASLPISISLDQQESLDSSNPTIYRDNPQDLGKKKVFIDDLLAKKAKDIFARFKDIDPVRFGKVLEVYFQNFQESFKSRFKSFQDIGALGQFVTSRFTFFQTLLNLGQDNSRCPFFSDSSIFFKTYQDLAREALDRKIDFTLLSPSQLTRNHLTNEITLSIQAQRAEQSTATSRPVGILRTSRRASTDDQSDLPSRPNQQFGHDTSDQSRLPSRSDQLPGNEAPYYSLPRTSFDQSMLYGYQTSSNAFDQKLSFGEFAELPIEQDPSSGLRPYSPSVPQSSLDPQIYYSESEQHQSQFIDQLSFGGPHYSLDPDYDPDYQAAKFTSKPPSQQYQSDEIPESGYFPQDDYHERPASPDTQPKQILRTLSTVAEPLKDVLLKSAHHQKTIQSLELTLEHKENKIIEQQQEISFLKLRYQDQSRKISLLQDALDESRAILEEEKKKSSEKDAEISDLRDKVKHSNQLISQQTGQIDDLKQAIVRQRRVNYEIQSALAYQGRVNDELRQSIEEKHKAILQLQSTVESILNLPAPTSQESDDRQSQEDGRDSIASGGGALLNSDLRSSSPHPKKTSLYQGQSETSNSPNSDAPEGEALVLSPQATTDSQAVQEDRQAFSLSFASPSSSSAHISAISDTSNHQPSSQIEFRSRLRPPYPVDVASDYAIPLGISNRGVTRSNYASHTDSDRKGERPASR